ncbi:hypothetical protein ACLBR5_20185 [Escherichia coli]
MPSTNLVCGSGLKAVHRAVQAIRCGDADWSLRRVARTPATRLFY